MKEKSTPEGYLGGDYPFLLIIGGLYAGWFTATEAAGMGPLGLL